MTIIDSDHGLSGQNVTAETPVQLLGYGPPRSSYGYLFNTLANDPNVGLFPNTSADATLARLKEFEIAYRGLGHPKPPKMNLAPVYTYFGQFVNHDISAPVGGLAAEAADIAPVAVITQNAGDPPGLGKPGRAENTGIILDRILNEHGAPLTLDSLYADGPQRGDQDVKAMYRADAMRFRIELAVRLDDRDILALTKVQGPVHHPFPKARDIPRKDGQALIADRRNDENLILSQLHLALMLLHNKAVDQLHPQTRDPAECFKAARQLVTLHYQWCVVHDYLANLLADGVLADVLAKPPRLANAREVPMEFTTAAFRFGHSMVSPAYDFNANFGIGGGLRDHATLMELFSFTSRGGMVPFPDATQLPDHWIADWNRLTRPPGDTSFGADAIDMNFAYDMLNVMAHGANEVHGSIFFRNLVRGFHRRLPFGQDLARAYDLTPLTPDQIMLALPAELRTNPAIQGFDTHTPAWLYCLCEAQPKVHGQKLGPLASHIIADTIVGLLKHNPNSVLRVDNGGWTPASSPLKSGDQNLDSIRALLLYAMA